MPKHKGAYKKSPKTIKIILDAISDGLTQRDASILAGISEDTLSRWKGQNTEFAEQIRQKEIEFKRRNIRTIQEASKKSWQASAWLLERKFKDEFSVKTKIENDLNERLEKAIDGFADFLNS